MAKKADNKKTGTSWMKLPVRIKQCDRCGSVTGRKYMRGDGTTVGITLRRAGENKDGTTRYLCQFCKA